MSTIFEKIKSLQDAYDYLGESRESMLIPDPKNTYQVSANHFMDAQVLAAALNERSVFDYDSYDEKYVFYWDLRSSAGGGSGFALVVVGCDITASYVGPRLSFKSRKLALHAFKIAPDTFRGLIKKD